MARVGREVRARGRVLGVPVHGVADGGAQVKKSSKHKLAVVATLSFFFGLPLAGMLYVYFAAHSALRSSAIDFAEKEVPQILAQRDMDELVFLGTVEFKSSFKPEDFVRTFDDLGGYREIGEFEVERSTVTQKGEYMWQIVDLRAPVTFARAKTELRLRATRRSTSLGEWRIDKWVIGHEDME
jgi:hypothetical protein